MVEPPTAYELEREPFPIRCEVTAHQQHDPHHSTNKFPETDRERKGIATTCHPLNKIVFTVVPNAKAFFSHPSTQDIFRILVKSRPPPAKLATAIYPDFPMA